MPVKLINGGTGSLFMDEKTPWNVAHLPNLLNRWDLRHLPGVNAPYLYFGMWGASFAWHVEDVGHVLSKRENRANAHYRWISFQ